MFRVPDAAPIDLRAVRAQREQALWRVKLACGTAWLAAAWATVVFGLIAIDTQEWAPFWSVVLGACLTAGLGWWLWARQNPTAAWLLGVLATGNLVFRVMYTGSAGGVVIGLLVCLAYFRGWQGAEKLRELQQADAADAPAAPVPSAQ